MKKNCIKQVGGKNSHLIKNHKRKIMIDKFSILTILLKLL